MGSGNKIPFYFRERRWRHPSVRALQEMCGCDPCPEQIIRKRAGELVEYGQKLGWSGPPYDPRILASILDIRVKARNLRAGTDGLLRVKDGGELEIIVNEKLPQTRQNFTICHEISHTLFPDCCEIVRMRQQMRRAENYHWELESLCNLAASEFLMPTDKFARDVVYHGYSLQSVDTLKQRYGASPEAVVRRMVSTELEISCAVFLRRMYKPSEQERQSNGSSGGDQKKMRVDYTVPSRDFPCFIPRFKSVPSHSCVNRALASKDLVCATENWGLKHAPPFRVEAQAHPGVGGGNHGGARTLALLFPNYF